MIALRFLMSFANKVLKGDQRSQRKAAGGAVQRG